MNQWDAAKFLIKVTNEKVATPADVIRERWISDVLHNVAMRRVSEARNVLNVRPLPSPDPTTWFADVLAYK